MTAPSPRYPGRAPIDAYGNGGFRFAEMSHRGSILCLPSGVYAWSPASPAEIDAATLAPALAERGALGLLLLGTGRSQYCRAPRCAPPSTRPASRSRRWIPAPPAAPTMCCWPRGAP